MDSNLNKKLDKFKRTIAVAISLVAFCGVFYFVFNMAGGDNTETGVSALPETKDSYQEYKDYVSNTNKGIRNLLEGEQLRSITIYDYPPMDMTINPKDNPFAKNF